MNEKYSIIEVNNTPRYDEYGRTLVVLANPITVSPTGSMFVTEGAYPSTEEFIFPFYGDIVDAILRIARTESVWTPNPNDFEDVINSKGKNIHRHVSFYHDDYDETLNSNNLSVGIPGVDYKLEQLKQQYIHNGWMYECSFREFVQSRAYDDPGFLGWLFDTSELEGCYFWSLPGEYRDAFEKLINNL